MRKPFLRSVTLLGAALFLGAGPACTASTSPSSEGNSGIDVEPNVAWTTPGGLARFAASVAGAASQQVTWAVAQAGGGSIDATGLYSAPAGTGTFTVTATSVADANKVGSATVNVSTLPPTPLLADDRRTVWNPGLRAIGGIPHRTTIYRTLSPSGGNDTSAIAAALAACPPDQVVKLNAGTFNINGDGLNFARSNCTLRGSGTGAPGTGAGGTRLVKADRATNANAANLYVGGNPQAFRSSTNLAADAVKGLNTVTLVSNPGIQVGEIVLVDQVTNNDPRVFWGTSHDGPGGGSRRWFARQDRSLNQMLEVTAVNGNVLTFATPFHITFKTVYGAQLARYSDTPTRLAGVEDIYFYGGMGGDGHGNVSVGLCAYCWVKNIEAHWSVGTSVGFYGTYRCELRDSFIHETPDPNPGGAGYLSGLHWGASDNLVENNIMWSGNKNIVVRASGGGNVIAYNYMDDAFGGGFPQSPEAGLNAGHYTTPHMELLEGNYSHNFTGDSFWGNSIYITVFRNHLSAIRAAHPPLATYTDGGMPYGDYEWRLAVKVQYRSDYHSFIGNVLGRQGQTLLSHSGAYSIAQTGWRYEELARSVGDETVLMWHVGMEQTRSAWNYYPNSITQQTLQRDGNFDWVTLSQRWHGIGGAVGAGTPATIPDSLYLAQRPAFFGSNPWPWVDPSSGAVYTLPAKARFEAMALP